MTDEGRALTHAEVMDILPHRDPMLLIDTAAELVPGQRVTASFWVDPAGNLPGPFPGEPVLPGVYTVEAMAQFATDLVLMTKPCYAGKVPLFLEMEYMSVSGRRSFRRHAGDPCPAAQ